MIENVFEELKTDGFVKSGNEFSREWLGMEESYMRCLRAKDRSPSVRALMNCSQRLMSAGEALGASEMGEVKRKGLKLKELANVCVVHALGDDLNKVVAKAIVLGSRAR
jgi:hypothetical protein